MNIPRKYTLIATAALAGGIALPALCAAADMPSSISTRSFDAIERDAGRAGVDAYWEQRQPTEPPAPIVKAYSAAKAETVMVSGEAKTLVTEPAPPHQAERYGRAGGFVGADEIQMPGDTRSPSAADWYGRAGMAQHHTGG
jgi:hypothetical protein